MMKFRHSHRRKGAPLLLFSALALYGISLAQGDCGSAAPALQVLGSGGPIAENGRAASGYILWIEGKSRLLVDAGGGVFLRFGEAGARIEDLDLVALTHLHVDHTADLPALLKSGFFAARSRPLSIAGPDGNALMPATDEFLRGLFDRDKGVYRYLSGFLNGSDGLFKLDAIVVPAARTEQPRAVLERVGLRVEVTGVSHGPIPALAFKITLPDGRIAFSGDLNGENPDFVRMIRDADLLVMDHAVPEQADPIARRLHATPEEIGRMAGEARVKFLLLSHRMGRTLGHESESLALIRRHYAGPVQFADDLQCLPIAPTVDAIPR